jgi:hypothetical protein
MADEWGLLRLYSKVTPAAVQRAEGVNGCTDVRPPILCCFVPGDCTSYVLTERDELTGCLQMTRGTRGVWWTLWVDTLQPGGERVHQLVQFGLHLLQHEGYRQPVYIAVCDYHGGLGALLEGYGFAPFTDRAKMVKHVVQWASVLKEQELPAIETVGKVVSTPYLYPKGNGHSVNV